MHYEFEFDGRLRSVVVHRVGDRFAVEVDGRRWHIDAARIDAQSLSLIVAVVPPKRDIGDAADAQDRSEEWTAEAPRFGGCSHNVMVSPDTEGRSIVHVGTASFALTRNGRRRRKDEDGDGAGIGPRRIAAPMPGKIVRVLVATGEVVHARQPLIVVEAMKMENELRAGRDGTIARIHVKEGASVDAGAPLIDIL